MSLRLARRGSAAFPGLDSAADRVQPLLQRLLGDHRGLRNVLAGRWLGAPLHPALTDVAVGALTTAVTLDLVGGRSRRLGDGPLLVAVVSSLPAAASGASDWASLQGEQRRIGSLHAVCNSAGLLLNVASLGLRARGLRGAGQALSFSSLLLTGFAAHLGGQLSFGLGVGLNRTATEAAPEGFVDVLAERSLDDEELHAVQVGDAGVLVAKTAGGICAISATCSHLGGPLTEGEREGDIVTCPWHGSKFDLCTGEVVAAPAVFAQPRYEARIVAGRVQLHGTNEASGELGRS